MKKNNKAFSIVEVIIAIFIFSVAILGTVVLKSQIVDQQDIILSSHKMIYFSDYINKIIQTKIPTHSVIGDKSYITISGEVVTYSSDAANKTGDIGFFVNNDIFTHEHEIEYIGTNNIEGVDVYTFKISLKINSEEKIYYLTV
ncbi:MAG: prepilin-type N-terminal cleavage/methylation domain-containing protein [Candidatus Gracilibacteria bacterium]|nr:prepilin-type N-terminal cleavage/methylation domain-containing protein [Candidatus Gracilibacteria bacterium]